MLDVFILAFDFFVGDLGVAEVEFGVLNLNTFTPFLDFPLEEEGVLGVFKLFLFFLLLLDFPEVLRVVGRVFLGSDPGVKKLSRLAWDRERLRDLGEGLGSGSDWEMEVGPRLNFLMYSSWE